MKNKKVILSLIIICIIIVLFSIGIIYLKQNTDSNSNIINSNKVEDFENVNEVDESIIETNKEDDEVFPEDTTLVDNANETNNVVENKNEEAQTTTSKKENTNSQTTIKAPTQPTTKPTTQTQPFKSVENKQEVPKTTEIIEAPKQETKPEVKVEKCTTNNNHSVGIGNSGKWFSNKNEAIAYYNSIVKSWGEKWENEEIDDATYYKNTPSGYEVWDCALCGKWTINFYYR